MRKVKSPIEKKFPSYENDRRNVYGENNKSSRKNIRKGKQRSQMRTRRTVGLILSTMQNWVHSEVTRDTVCAAEQQARVAVKINKMRAFKKSPDQPLRRIVEDKLARRKQYD